MAEHTQAFYVVTLFELCGLMVQSSSQNTVCCGADIYLEVIWKEQFAGPEETENVAEYLAVPIYEVVLLQAVQHDGLGAIEQTTDSENWNTDTNARRQPHTNTHANTHTHIYNRMSQFPSNAWNNYPPFIFQFY